MIEKLEVFEPKLKDLELKANQLSKAHEFLCQPNEQMPTSLKKKLIDFIENFHPDLKASDKKKAGRPEKSMEDCEKIFLEKEEKKQELCQFKGKSDEDKKKYWDQVNRSSAQRNRNGNKSEVTKVTEDLKTLFEMTNNKGSRLRVPTKDVIRAMITGHSKPK